MAASLSFVSRQILRRNFLQNSTPVICLTGVRHYKWQSSKPLREFYRRRLIVGPDKARKRSEWANWNYKAEIYSFGKRLDEDLNDKNLRTALVDKSYVEEELERRKKVLSGDEVLSFNLEHNEELAESGRKIASEYIGVFLQHNYPKLPKDGISSVHDHLMSRKVLANIGKHIGLNDIILCEGFPDEEVFEQSFLAVIGCLAEDAGCERAYRFIQDFITPELVGKDINDIWNIMDPMGTLCKILSTHGLNPPEPRLIHSCGQETVVACFYVGIYTDKKLIGKSYGETPSIAEEEAACDALNHFFGTELHNQQLNFESTILDVDNLKQLEAV